MTARSMNAVIHTCRRELVDNLVAPSAKVSVVPWERLNEGTLSSLVDLAFDDRATCEYDLGRRMRRSNS